MSQPVYGPPVYTTQVVAVAPPPKSTAHVVVAWVLAVLTGFYLLPWAIAATRAKRNTGAIALINIFLGWTFAGWVAALVMACLNDDRPAAVVIHQPTPPFVGVSGPGYAPPRLPAATAYAQHPAIPAAGSPFTASPHTAVDPWTTSADEPTRPIDLSQGPQTPPGPHWR